MREETLSGCPVIRMGDVHKEVLSRLQFAAGIFLMRIPSDFYGLMVFLFLEQRCAHFTPGGAHLCRTAALAACVHQKRILIHFKSYAHKYPKRLYIWNGALYNKRELLRHAAQAACPSEKQMLDSVLNGNTVFFLRAPRQSIHGQGRGGSRRAAVRRRYGWARHGPQAHFQTLMFSDPAEAGAEFYPHTHVN